MQESFYLIVFLFACIQVVEFSAVLARLAGMASQKNMVGYSIQQSFLVGTRLFQVVMLPLLGLMVDSGVTEGFFRTISHLSLFIAALFCLMALGLRIQIVAYFISVIETYSQSQNFVKSFLRRQRARGIAPQEMPKLPGIFTTPAARKIFSQSSFVYAIYSMGLFLSFYFAILFPEYRASISQSSGIVNSLGAIILTFYIEPRISHSIDKNDPTSGTLVLALLAGRLAALLIVSQAMLLGVFFVAEISWK